MWPHSLFTERPPGWILLLMCMHLNLHLFLWKGHLLITPMVNALPWEWMEILLCMLRRSKTWPTLDFGYDDCTLPSGPHSKDLGGTMTGKHKIWGLGCWGRWGHLQDNCTILKNTYPIVEDYSEMFSSGWLYRNVHLRFCNIHMLLMPRYVYCFIKEW